MATAQQLIDKTLRLLGIVATGETPATAERDDALIILNEMIETWNTERLTIFVVERNASLTLTANQASHTIGSGGQLAVTRPLKIENAGYKAAGSDIEDPLKILTLEEWQLISDKTQTGKPSCLYYEPDYATARGDVFLWPIQNEAGTLVLYLWQQLSSALTLATTLAYPPGYERALRYNLALELAPEYGMPVPPLIYEHAKESKAKIQALNSPEIHRRCDDALLRPGYIDLLSLT